VFSIAIGLGRSVPAATRRRSHVCEQSLGGTHDILIDGLGSGPQPTLRIVQLVEDLELGGLERLAVDLAIAQQQTGHQAIVYCLHQAGALAGRLEAAGIPVVAFRKGPGFSPGVVLRMARRMHGDRVDVVHGHNPGVHHYAALAARLAGVPVSINTRHSAATSQGLPYQERYFRWVRPLTGHVVFVCDYVRRLLERQLNYPPAKCSVILNGIPLEGFLARPASPGSRLPRIRFGTIGRLVPAKGHSILIDAFARVCRQAPAAELSIFGHGPLAAELAGQIVRLGLEGKVRLEGRTDDSPGALQGLDVFVLSSLYEGLPLVILEAMAAGLPILSTNVGGVPEVLSKESAWLCPPGDAEALASAMLQAVECHELQERGETSRRTAAASYGIEHMARRYEELYRRLLPIGAR
jgi:glycosyltransferase involved in cell wall biosynthesis